MQDDRSYSRILNVDPITRTKRLFHWDAASESFHIETVMDHEDIVEHNKLLHNEATDRGWKGDMVKVASLPIAVWYDLKQKGILDDQKAFRRWLNDPDNLYFRTRPGRV